MGVGPCELFFGSDNCSCKCICATLLFVHCLCSSDDDGDDDDDDGVRSGEFIDPYVINN